MRKSEELKIEAQQEENDLVYLGKMRHKVRVIPKEEILNNRCNKYEFLNFDNMENKTITESLKEYFETTSREKIEKDWAESSDIGVTVDDFLAANKIQNQMIEELREYTNKFEGTDRYNDIMEAIEFGFQLNSKYYGKE